MKKVILIGAGAQATVITGVLSRASDVSEILVTDIDEVRAQELAEVNGSEKVSAEKIDASDIDAMAARAARLVEARGKVQDRLGQLDLDVWPSEANFILFRPRRRDAAQVWQDLVDRSVLVRDCSSWPRLEGCLRVTIGSAEENDRFLTALEAVLESPGGPVSASPEPSSQEST